MATRYVRPATPEEYRAALLALMQGKEWRRLCIAKHESVELIKRAAESLRDA